MKNPDWAEIALMYRNEPSTESINEWLCAMSWLFEVWEHKIITEENSHYWEVDQLIRDGFGIEDYTYDDWVGTVFMGDEEIVAEWLI